MRGGRGQARAAVPPGTGGAEEHGLRDHPAVPQGVHSSPRTHSVQGLATAVGSLIRQVRKAQQKLREMSYEAVCSTARCAAHDARTGQPASSEAKQASIASFLKSCTGASSCACIGFMHMGGDSGVHWTTAALGGRQWHNHWP